MPVYEYFCVSCQKGFELALTLHEHDEEKIKCPKCGSQMVSAFTAVTSKKS
jgi:putative FmdB family regulatory protein